MRNAKIEAKAFGVNRENRGLTPISKIEFRGAPKTGGCHAKP